jgi:hypothetical protein
MFSPHRLVVLAASSLVGLALVAVPALATQTKKIDSKITLPPNEPAFHGRVESRNPACERQRKVKLFKQHSGPDKLLGTDKTNNHGKWKILVNPLKPGGYYAKVVRREEGTAGTIFICRGDRSIVATIVPH